MGILDKRQGGDKLLRNDEAKEASDQWVATAKATNTKTQVTQCGAHSQPKLISGRPDPDNAQAKAEGKAVRNAILKVIPEYIVYDFANNHAQEPPWDYQDAYHECVKVFTQKGLGEWHVANITTELYPDQKPASIDRKSWVRIFRSCQSHASELNENPDVERSKSYWAKTEDGQIVAVTEGTGEKSPASPCEFYQKGKCQRVLVKHPYFYLSHCHPKVDCNGNPDSNACTRIKEQHPRDFGVISEEYKAKYYKDGKFDPDYWKRGVDEIMANLKGMTVEEYRESKKATGNEETISETEALDKIYVAKTERGKWALKADDGSGFPGDVLTEGGGDYYPVPLNSFKGIREASVYAKKHYPDAEVAIISNI